MKRNGEGHSAHSGSHVSAALRPKRCNSAPSYEGIKALGLSVCKHHATEDMRSSPTSYLLTVSLSLESRSNMCRNYSAFNFRTILKSYQDRGFSLVLTSTPGTVHCEETSTDQETVSPLKARWLLNVFLKHSTVRVRCLLTRKYSPPQPHLWANIVRSILSGEISVHPHGPWKTLKSKFLYCLSACLSASYPSS